MNTTKGVLLTGQHLILALFVLWMLGGLPTVTWLALIQFMHLTYWQVSLPYILLYSLVVSFELIRGFVKKGA